MHRPAIGLTLMNFMSMCAIAFNAFSRCTSDGPITKANRRLVSQYRELFAYHDDGIKVVDWTQKNMVDIIEQLLLTLRAFYPKRKGIKNITDTLISLSQKHPELIGKGTAELSEITHVVSMLQEIKARDTYVSYGKIISRALAKRRVTDLQLPLALSQMSDKNLEYLLSEYLEQLT